MNDRMREALGSLVDDQAARREDCPPPEIWHELASGLLGERGTLSASASVSPAWTAAWLESHAADCGVCAAELDLARAFVEEAEAAGVRSESVVSIEQVRARRAAEPPPASAWKPSSSTWLAAAAVVFALIAGYSFWVVRMPVAQGPGSGAVMRGEAIRLITPVDVIDEVPAALEWESASGGAEYRVEVRRLDGRLVLGREVTEPRLELTPAERELLQHLVTYEWRVRALSDDQSPAEASATFRIQASSGDTN